MLGYTAFVDDPDVEIAPYSLCKCSFKYPYLKELLLGNTFLFNVSVTKTVFATTQVKV